MKQREGWPEKAYPTDFLAYRPPIQSSVKENRLSNRVIPSFFQLDMLYEEIKDECVFSIRR